MSTYQKVVVGVHGSPTGRRAVELAAPLSTEAGSRLVLVAAYGDGHRRPHESGPYQEFGPGPAELALKRALEICEEFGVSNVEVDAVAGDPVTVLVNAVREHQADVLLVGSHGLSTLGGRLLGSVPGGVVREAECDVLVVQTTTQRWRMRRQDRRTPSSYRRTVLVGVHDTPRSRRALEKAAGIAVDTDADLLLVGVHEEPPRWALEHASNALDNESYMVQGSFLIENVLRDAERRARALGVRAVEQVLVKGDPMEALLTVADERGADLLVIGNHRLTGPMSQLIGSISDQVSRKTPTHVLLVH